MQRRQRLLFIGMLMTLVGSSPLFAALAANPLYQPSQPAPVSTSTTANKNTSSDNSGAVLTQIKINTDAILQRINQLPASIQTMLQTIMEFKDNMTRTQESGKQPDALIFSTQGYMDAMGQLFQYGIARDPNSTDSNNNNIDAFNNYLLQLQKEGFASSQSVGSQQFDVASFNPIQRGSSTTAIEGVIPNINALTYTTAIGLTPLTPAQPASSWTDTYIKAASGANLYHSQLNFMSSPITISQQHYRNYFNLTYAIQSFNNYVLGKYILNNTQISQNQSTLYRKASSSDYLTSVASEPIGYVLRDILLFQSQQYVLTSKLVEMQRETLMAHVMTNALLIAANRQTESALYDKAQQR